VIEFDLADFVLSQEWRFGRVFRDSVTLNPAKKFEWQWLKKFNGQTGLR
jgi:hypothetical protein